MSAELRGLAPKLALPLWKCFRSPRIARAFCLVRPAGRTYLEVEVLYRPGKGNG